MTAKEYVKQYYPDARCECFSEKVLKGLRWSYQVNLGTVIVRGYSLSNVWVNAKRYIQKEQQCVGTQEPQER